MASCNCIFDSKLFLEYLKVILSFPTVVLVLVGVAFTIFKKDIRQLFPRVSKLGTSGIELNPVVAAAALQVEIAAADKQQQPLLAAIDQLPEGREKELVQAAQVAAAEANRERLIASSLREQLVSASKPKVFNEPSKKEVFELTDLIMPTMDFKLLASQGGFITPTLQPDGSYRVTMQALQNLFRWEILKPKYEALIQDRGVRIVVYAIETAFRRGFDVDGENYPSE